MVKELNVGKGHLGMQTNKSSRNTIRMVKKAFPTAQFMVSGHGRLGGQELLDYTKKLFEMK